MEEYEDIAYAGFYHYTKKQVTYWEQNLCV